MENSSRSFLPAPLEDEIATIRGSRQEAALRVRLIGGQESTVRLEQLIYSRGLGWYVQKSFCIPSCMLAELIPQLRKADCLAPRRPGCKPEAVSQLPALLPFTGPDRKSKSA